MKFLFVITSNNETRGGSVFAPIIVRDVIVDFYKINIDTIFFKEANFFKLFFNLNISKPNFSRINDYSNNIEFESFAQLLTWLFKNIRKYDLSILHGIWANIIIITSLFCISQRKPFCIHSHGALDPFDINKKKKIIKNFIGNTIYKFIFNFSSGIIFTSSLELLRSRTFKAKVNKFIATLTSPNEEGIKEMNFEQISLIKEKYNITSNKKIILFLSRIDYKKGLDILIKCLSKLTSENKSILLLIAGEGEKTYVGYIKNIIKNLGIDNHIKFLGHIKGRNKYELMQISDLFVLPSLNENFGIAVVEALQNKLPVVISKEVYIHEEIINHNAGYLCSRDPEQLSNLINSLLFSEKGLNSKTNNQIDCFEKYFSRKKCAADHFKIYTQILDQF